MSATDPPPCMAEHLPPAVAEADVMLGMYAEMLRRARVIVGPEAAIEDADTMLLALGESEIHAMLLAAMIRLADAEDAR
jgi:hypothetical protein